MYRKIINITLPLIIILLTFSSCSYPAYKHYYTDTNDYSKIWELAGFNHGYEDISLFFPEKLENLNVKDFYCRYDEQLPLGEGTQVFLKIHYNDISSFNSEKDRIISLSSNCNEYFEQSNYKAYATRLGDDGSSEYALIDETQQIIYYIFLQDLPKEQIEFDHRLLPTGYTEYGDIKN